MGIRSARTWDTEMRTPASMHALRPLTLGFWDLALERYVSISLWCNEV